MVGASLFQRDFAFLACSILARFIRYSCCNLTAHNKCFTYQLCNTFWESPSNIETNGRQQQAACRGSQAWQTEPLLHQLVLKKWMPISHREIPCQILGSWHCSSNIIAQRWNASDQNAVSSRRLAAGRPECSLHKWFSTVWMHHEWKNPYQNLGPWRWDSNIIAQRWNAALPKTRLHAAHGRSELASCHSKQLQKTAAVTNHSKNSGHMTASIRVTEINGPCHRWFYHTCI